MIEFFEQVTLILTVSVDTISSGADALREYNFNDSIATKYLGHMHYFMGTPLYLMFATSSLIGIAASLWSFILKGVNWIIEMIPGA